MEGLFSRRWSRLQARMGVHCLRCCAAPVLSFRLCTPWVQGWERLNPASLCLPGGQPVWPGAKAGVAALSLPSHLWLGSADNWSFVRTEQVGALPGQGLCRVPNGKFLCPGSSLALLWNFPRLCEIRSIPLVAGQMLISAARLGLRDLLKTLLSEGRIQPCAGLTYSTTVDVNLRGSELECRDTFLTTSGLFPAACMSLKQHKELKPLSPWHPQPDHPGHNPLCACFSCTGPGTLWTPRQAGGCWDRLSVPFMNSELPPLKAAPWTPAAGSCSDSPPLTHREIILQSSACAIISGSVRISLPPYPTGPPCHIHSPCFSLSACVPSLCNGLMSLPPARLAHL